MTALLSEISIFWVRAVYEIRLASYGSKHALQPRSDTPFVHTYAHNLKTTGCIWMLYISNDCHTIRHIQFLVPNTRHSLFPIYHLCILTRITWKLQVVHECSAYPTTALLSKTLFVWFKVAWETRLKNYAPTHALIIFWYKIVCADCKPVHTLLFRAKLHTTTKLMYLMTTYYCMHQMTVSLVMMHCFIRTKLASEATHCSVFLINWVC